MTNTFETFDIKTCPPIVDNLFSKNVELLPSVDEIFELELAYLEYHCLDEQERLDRLAYFKAINNKFTKHYLMYNRPIEAITNERSGATKTYFENGLFSTGYATHSLFPYRGKFHPQLIKALINIIGIKKGDTILDPMCGSGTTNIEAAMNGINSYAIDLSPFCQLMTKVKYDCLSVNNDKIKGLSLNSEMFFNYFNGENIQERLSKITDDEELKLYELALLAFLDSLGYSKRVVSSSHRQLFTKVLKRYEETIIDFNRIRSNHIVRLGAVTILDDATAFNTTLGDESIDGIITSPPYSFAIDYVKNDEPQLKYMGHNLDNLRNQMIGLSGRNKNERLANYFNDMNKVCSEAARVLKNNKYLIIIVGSNTNQTEGIRLEGKIIESCENNNLILVKSILKPIKGLRNTLKDEYILMFRKEGVM